MNGRVGGTSRLSRRGSLVRPIEAGRLYAFDVDRGLLQLASEAYRISLAYLFDPYLAVSASQIEALPHQITAVYGEMLPRQPLMAAAETPEGLLSQIIEAVSQPEIPPDVTEVRIMSLHKSKGLNWPIVVIAGRVDGLLPAEPEQGTSIAERQAILEEQRRLFYVGITRVKAAPSSNRPGQSDDDWEPDHDTRGRDAIRDTACGGKLWGRIPASKSLYC